MVSAPTGWWGSRRTAKGRPYGVGEAEAVAGCGRALKSGEGRGPMWASAPTGRSWLTGCEDGRPKAAPTGECETARQLWRNAGFMGLRLLGRMCSDRCGTEKCGRMVSAPTVLGRAYMLRGIIKTALWAVRGNPRRGFPRAPSRAFFAWVYVMRGTGFTGAPHMDSALCEGRPKALPLETATF